MAAAVERREDFKPGYVLSLDGGLGYALTRTTQVYGFVQFPVYEYVNGVQLTADVAYVAGLRMAR